MTDEPRFFVDTVSGKLEPGSNNHPFGITASVHDRLVLCRNVGQYRSEDETRGLLTHQERVGRAVQRAYEHAHRLNEAEAASGELA